MDRTITPADLHDGIDVELDETAVGNDSWGIASCTITFRFSGGSTYEKLHPDFVWMDEGKDSVKYLHIP